MGMTIEFYSAEPQALVAVFAADAASEEGMGDSFFGQLKAYPMADFSLHLQLPEDLVSLCHLLSEQDQRIPPVFSRSACGTGMERWTYDH